ncbi:MAG TPA: hypothetical protein VHV31_04095 [Nitrolancea sp.]|nr:hypothetical protein [Nitrolancea sp.]
MLKSIGIGVVAGVVATAVMDTSQTTLIPLVSSWIKSAGDKSKEAPPSKDSTVGETPESSPEKVAHHIARMGGIDLDREEISRWGNRVHWLYGTHWGAVYAILPLPRTPLAGLAYGAILWLWSDELLLWALGIAEKPTHYPFESHASALAAHVIYGGTLGTMLAGLELPFSKRPR